MIDEMTNPMKKFLFLKNRFMVSLQADPRVEQGVHQVDQKIDDHNDTGDEKNNGLNHREVPLVDCKINQPTQPRKKEDLLDDDGASHELSDLKAEDGQDRNHGVSKGVSVDDRPFPQAFASGRLNVVLSEDLKER